MTGKNAKRQRQKEQRRAKIAEEIRQAQVKRRRRSAINLSVVAIILAGALYFIRSGNEEKKDAKPKVAGCSEVKPATTQTRTPKEPPPMTIDPAKKYIAVVETSCGSIEIELAAATSPNTVNSFVFLAKEGFYNGLTFHRIVKDFAIQGGDPKGDGTGGPEYKTVDAPPADFKYIEGVVAMAKSGPEAPGTAGSQFFIVPGDGAEILEPVYAVLGKVVKGDAALAKLNALATQAKEENPEKSSPIKPVYIVRITIKES